MRTTMFGIRFLALAGLFTLAAGCGESGGGREAISGTIKFKGNPLDQGTIEFHPQDTTSKATFEGSTVSNGKYEIPKNKGLMPGKYKVIISSSDSKAKAEPVPGESGPPAKERIPAKYNSESAEIVEVKPGGPNVFDYDIK